MISEIQIMFILIFLMISRVCINILFIIKVEYMSFYDQLLGIGCGKYEV